MDAPSLNGASAKWLPRADDFICIKLVRPMQSGSAQGLTSECPLRSFVILLVQSVAMS